MKRALASAASLVAKPWGSFWGSPHGQLLQERSAAYRTRLAASTRWKVLMVFASCLNVVAEWPQVWGVWHTRTFAAVSPATFWMFLFLQSTFTINAWVNRDPFLLYSGVGAACASVAILVRLYGVWLGLL